MEYRNTPHSTTGEAPSTLFLGTVRSFEPGDPVCARDILHSGGQPGTITKHTGPLLYKVLFGNGQIWRRHIDHVKGNLGQHVTQPPDLIVLDMSQANSSHVSSDSEQNKENCHYPQQLWKPTEPYISY